MAHANLHRVLLCDIGEELQLAFLAADGEMLAAGSGSDEHDRLRESE